MSDFDYVGADIDDVIRDMYSGVGADDDESLESILSGVGAVPDYMVGDDGDDEDGWEEAVGWSGKKPRSVPLSKLKRGIKGLAMQLKAERRRRKQAELGAASKARALPQIFLGMDSGDGGAAPIAAAGTRTVRTEPTTPLRITDLIVQSAFAAAFTITRIDIGRLNLLAGGQAIPADAFISGVQRPPIEAPILPAGTEASITVVNNDGVAHQFRAMFVGIDIGRMR